MKFKYLKGSEKDFYLSSGWARFAAFNHKINSVVFLQKTSGVGMVEPRMGVRYLTVMTDEFLSEYEIIAHREPIAKTEKLGHGLDCEECIPAELTIDVKYRNTK